MPLSAPATARVRPATADDLSALTAILNRIIEAGGTTAHQTPMTSERLLTHYVAPDNGIACMVAEVEGPTGPEILGFQSLMWPNDEGTRFPDGWAIIASFVDAKGAGRGIGRQLFGATTAAARAAGVTAIDATIRADNDGGLAYYTALGFEDYDVIAAVPLRDGTRVDRVRKKFDLT